MEIVILVVVVALAFAFLLRNLLRRFGIGTRGGKPDCGCGRCEPK